MKPQYETQDLRPGAWHNGTAFVWRCARCGRFLARIERLDGVLEVYHKCGAMNRLAGTLGDAETASTSADHLLTNE